MRYQTLTVAPDHKVLIKTIPCPDCKSQEVYLVPEASISAYDAGAFMQEAFPMLNAGQRERLISGICSPCFDKMFPPEELEEEDPDGEMDPEG